jgi:hypothetical protein
VWALVVAGAAVFLYFLAALLVMAGISQHITPDATPQEVQQALLEDMRAGNVPATVIVGSLLGMVSMACWVAGIVLGILALTRSPARRGLAVGSLVLGGLMFGLFCMGAVNYF